MNAQSILNAGPVTAMETIESDAAEAKFSRKRAGSPYTDELARDSAKARAAVVELIEASEEVMKFPDHEASCRLARALCSVRGNA